MGFSSTCCSVSGRGNGTPPPHAGLLFGYGLIGVIMMSVALGMLVKVWDWITPIDGWELLKNDNIAVAIVVSSVFIAFAIVVAAALNPGTQAMRCLALLLAACSACPAFDIKPENGSTYANIRLREITPTRIRVQHDTYSSFFDYLTMTDAVRIVCGYEEAPRNAAKAMPEQCQPLIEYGLWLQQERSLLSNNEEGEAMLKIGEIRDDLFTAGFSLMLGRKENARISILNGGPLSLSMNI